MAEQSQRSISYETMQELTPSGSNAQAMHTKALLELTQMYRGRDLWAKYLASGRRMLRQIRSRFGLTTPAVVERL
jgi:hypothetical protein